MEPSHSPNHLALYIREGVLPFVEEKLRASAAGYRARELSIEQSMRRQNPRISRAALAYATAEQFYRGKILEEIMGGRRVSVALSLGEGMIPRQDHAYHQNEFMEAFTAVSKFPGVELTVSNSPESQHPCRR